jgi:serine phosphatase RsbU (regulator of sigma subunit)
MSFAESAPVANVGVAPDAELLSSETELSQANARWTPLLPLATLVIGLVVTLALVLVSHAQYVSNEKRLLRLRVRDAGALVTAATPNTQTPLGSAAELADATGGNVAKFQRFASPYLLTGAQHAFASISLWRVSSLNAGPVAVLGVAPKLAGSRAAATAFLAKAARTAKLSVTGLLSAPDPRLGYAYGTPGAPGAYVAYGENPLPANRHSRLQSNSAFANLDYAIYLGAGQRPQQLLVSNVTRLPLPSPTDAETLAFGDSALTVVMSSRVPLAGSLPQKLPWIIAGLGTLLSIAAALMTLRLTQRRRDAEQLAGELDVSARENRRLYAEQRGIAQTLQHALLPANLPQLPGMEASARYEAGERGVDIGGDWYDVIELADSRLLMVVGDVSGRGLPAATTMASLRFAIRAYAAQNDPPEEILTKISHLVDVAESGQLATVLCALVDIKGRQITITSAGHLPPLLLSGGQGRYVDAVIGVPIGVESGATYTSTTISAPPESTFVAFTDGLVELRGESLDQGLARLREFATRAETGLPELLGALVSEMPHGASEDDIAIVGVRWTS